MLLLLCGWFFMHFQFLIPINEIAADEFHRNFGARMSGSSKYRLFGRYWILSRFFHQVISTCDRTPIEWAKFSLNRRFIDWNFLNLFNQILADDTVEIFFGDAYCCLKWYSQWVQRDQWKRLNVAPTMPAITEPCSASSEQSLPNVMSPSWEKPSLSIRKQRR